MFSVLGYGALTTGAAGPGFGTVPQLAELSAPVIAASLSFSGSDVIITGSVDHIFESDSFVGPNRALKQDRPRISVDALAFTRAFEETRARLAALRHPAGNSAGGEVTQVAAAPDAAAEAKPAEEQQRIEVAAINPVVGSSALDAIDDLAASADQTVPLPVVASEQLAYARANEPVTGNAESPATKVADKELWCLATAIYFEARGEAYRGQVAVAQVVMNRVKHKLYPKTICGVVFQNQQKRNACQFSFACDGQPETVRDRKAWAQAEEIASQVVTGELYLAEVANSTHYHATYVYPHWAPRMKKVTKIGLHVFYRFKRGWSFG